MRSSPSDRPVRHAFVVLAAVLSLAAVMHEASASGQGFPFDHELRFDANPMRGSKRVPGLQITKNGAAYPPLVRPAASGHAVVIENQITIVPTAMQDNQCPADRLRAGRGFAQQSDGGDKLALGWSIAGSGRAEAFAVPASLQSTRRQSAVDRTMGGRKRIALIGAGIGGLTAARALALRGFEVRVFEQSDELKEVGAGI